MNSNTFTFKVWKKTFKNIQRQKDIQLHLGSKKRKDTNTHKTHFRASKVFQIMFKDAKKCQKKF